MFYKILQKIKTNFRIRRKELIDNWAKEYFYEYSSTKLSAMQSVLDIACGIGEFLKYRGNNCVAIDGNLTSLEQARTYCPNLVHGDILVLPFLEGSFDGINCSHAIEHLSPDQVYRLLIEINKVLRVNGIIVFSGPTMWEGFYSDLTHVRPYYPNSILHYLGPEKVQSTKTELDCHYELLDVQWRYAKMPLRTLLLPRSVFLNTFLWLFTDLLNRIGFGRYLKTGYTMVLKKLA